jgi:hypothetical protein
MAHETSTSQWGVVDETFDPEQDVVECAELDADDVLTLRMECEAVNESLMAARIEIEYRNIMHNDSYTPKFALHELADVATVLLSIIKTRRIQGQSKQATDVQEIGQKLFKPVDPELLGLPARAQNWDLFTGDGDSDDGDTGDDNE